MRVCTYSRYSSDLQDRRSIIDQQRELHAFARTRGWIVVADFADEAVSGESLHGRGGLADCLSQGRSGVYAGILLESVDRLSRSVADTASIQRDLDFHGVKLLTIADNGEVPPLVLALKGALSQQFIADLRQKVKRGQIGRVKAGKAAGGLSYGYRITAVGEREIDPEQAEVVHRIFTEYLLGRSGLDIATTLNREGIKGPRRNPWGTSAIMGNHQRGTGILNNALYVGQNRYGKLEYRKNPATGKRQSRLQAADKVISQDVPQLRIIDDAIWKAVQRMRATASTHKLPSRRRPRRALSGLLSCGECGSSYIVTQGEWCGCSAYKQRGTCTNKRMIKMDEIERRVFEALKSKLMAPDTVAAAIEAHRVEHDRLAKLHAKDRSAIEREIGEVKRRLSRLMESIETGEGELSELLPRQKELVAKRRVLEARLPDKGTVVALHPNIAARYKQMVDNIQATLARGDAHAHEAVTLVRSLITKIVVIERAHV